MTTRSCTATARNGVKCTNEFLPNSLLEQFCSDCIQKSNTRKEQIRRAQAKRRQLLRLQSPTLATGGLAQPVTRRCLSCSLLQSECSSSVFPEGASRCLSCTQKHRDFARAAYARRVEAARITEAAVVDREPTDSPSDGELDKPVTGSRPFSLGMRRPRVATGPSFPYNTKSLSSTSDTDDGPGIGHSPTMAAAASRNGSADRRQQLPSGFNQYGFVESVSSSTQTVPGTDDDDDNSEIPTRKRPRPVAKPSLPMHLSRPGSPAQRKALSLDSQSSSPHLLTRPTPVLVWPSGTDKRVATDAGSDINAPIGTPRPTHATGQRRKPHAHTGGAAPGTAATQISMPRRIYMSGRDYVSNVLAELEREKKRLLAAPLARPAAFGTPTLALSNPICCGLFKYDCTNRLSDASFCCGGKPKPVLQVLLSSCRTAENNKQFHY